MPVVRVCPHCNLTKIWSSYSLIKHVMNNHPEKAVVFSIDNKKIEVHKIKP